MKSKKKEVIKVRESVGTGRLKIQNSTNNDYINNVNYESDGEEAKMTFPGPSPQDESRNVSKLAINSPTKKTLDLNSNLKSQKTDQKRQSSKTRNTEVEQADIQEIYVPEDEVIQSKVISHLNSRKSTNKSSSYRSYDHI